jgi:hypothetical protein
MAPHPATCHPALVPFRLILIPLLTSNLRPLLIPVHALSLHSADGVTRAGTRSAISVGMTIQRLTSTGIPILLCRASMITRRTIVYIQSRRHRRPRPHQRRAHRRPRLRHVARSARMWAWQTLHSCSKRRPAHNNPRAGRRSTLA